MGSLSKQWGQAIRFWGIGSGVSVQTAMTGLGLNADRAWKAALSALFALFVLQPVFAADLAILSNGFSIRHDHRQVIGDTTRLFLSADGSSFTDIPTAQIVTYEKDLAPPPAPDLPAAASSANPAASPQPRLALPAPLHSARSTPLPTAAEL